jgi:hypothetical protein
METSPIKMTAESTNHMLGLQSQKFLSEFMFEPAEVKRTSEEKALILARLTLQLAALGQTGGPQDGNA